MSLRIERCWRYRHDVHTLRSPRIVTKLRWERTQSMFPTRGSQGDGQSAEKWFQLHGDILTPRNTSIVSVLVEAHRSRCPSEKTSAVLMPPATVTHQTYDSLSLRNPRSLAGLVIWIPWSRRGICYCTANTASANVKPLYCRHSALEQQLRCGSRVERRSISLPQTSPDFPRHGTPRAGTSYSLAHTKWVSSRTSSSGRTMSRTSTKMVTWSPNASPGSFLLTHGRSCAC